MESDVFRRLNLLYLCCVGLFTIFVLLFQIYRLLRSKGVFWPSILIILQSDRKGSLLLREASEEDLCFSTSTGSPSSKYEHRRTSTLLHNIRNIRICMEKNPMVSVTYENERISIKNSLPYIKCVLRLSLVVHGPIYGRLMGCTVNGFLSKPLYRGRKRSERGTKIKHPLSADMNNLLEQKFAKIKTVFYNCRSS